MALIDKLIKNVSPAWALRRERARYMLKAYEAAKPSRLHKKRTDTGSGDSIVGSAGASLRMQARHLDENHDLARGVLSVLVNQVVGNGIRVEPQVRDKKGKLLRNVNQQLTALHRDWMLSPDVTGQVHWNAAQRIAARTWFRDGETFTQLLRGDIKTLEHNTRVPFSIELIEPDYVPIDYNDEKKRIIQGVQKNAWGRPLNYYFYKSHPGDRLFSRVTQDTKRVPAENVLHLKLIDRIGQTRGVTVFASVLNRLDDIKDYEESERVAARVAAAMTAYIKKGSEYIPTTAQTSERSLAMAPGMIFDDLAPGEEIGTIQSNRPSGALEPFRQGQLKAVAAGTTTGYSSIAKDYNGSYSAQRQELVEQSVHYAALRDHFVERFCRPTWREFVKVAIAAGLVQIPKETDLTTIDDADFRGPSLPWIDPLKELKANEGLVQAGFKSRSQVIREMSGSPADVTEQIVQERADELDKGLTFTTNTNTAKPPDTSQPVQDGQKFADQNGNRYIYRHATGWHRLDDAA
ncbi:MAG: phage portal protein [Rhodospirillaceae bacterium]|nr:phage portal protein [Rhodospirillaceae bacterium]